MSNRKKNKNTDEQQIAAEKKKTEKSVQYPKNLFVVKDPEGADLGCLNSYGSACMTVRKLPDNGTVAYIREDKLENENERNMKKAQLQQAVKAKENLLNRIDEQENFQKDLLSQLNRKLIGWYVVVIFQCCATIAWYFVIPQKDFGWKELVLSVFVTVNVFVLHTFLCTVRAFDKRLKQQESGNFPAEKS